MTKLNINRRNFLKAAGVTTAVGAAAATTAVVVPKVSKAEYNQPSSTGVNMAIKYLDEPSYNYYPYADADKVERYDSSLTPNSNQEVLDLYCGGMKPRFWNVIVHKEKLAAGEAGYSLRDLALSTGAGVSNTFSGTLCDWGETYTPSYTEVNGIWEGTEEENSLMVKKAAHYYGAGAVGIAELNEQWAYDSFTFSDTATEPDSTNKIIPTSMNKIIVLLAPIDGTILSFAPTAFGGTGGSMGYSAIAEVISKMSYFVRELGYHAIADVASLGLNIPMAIDAGLGELGRHGLLINPEYGSLFKIGKVITDMPLAYDKPISFGAAEFCITCMKCAEACPSKSISFEAEPTYDAGSPSTAMGMKKWAINGWTCKELESTAAAACHVCARTCTYSKQQTWVHDVVKVIASKTTMFNSIFATMDDAFGYGETWEYKTVEDIDAWWSGDDRSFNWLYDM